GISLNGIQANGIQANGIQANGIQANGVQLQGSTLQGARLQGAELEGLRLAGLDHLALVGTTLALLDVDSRPVAEPEALVGLSLPAVAGDDAAFAVHVDTVRHDEGKGITYYGLSIDGAALCSSGEGLFDAGRWDEHGDHHDDDVIS